MRCWTGYFVVGLPPWESPLRIDSVNEAAVITDLLPEAPPEFYVGS